MSADDSIREQILNSFRGTTDRRFEQAVADYPVAYLNVNPPNVDYSAWFLLEHLRISQRDLLDYVRNQSYVAPPHPAGYWPPSGATADAAAWTASLEQFRADREAFAALIADPSVDLLALMPHTPGHTVLREVLLDIGHSSYHLGELGILRQVMGTWPEGHV